MGNYSTVSMEWLFTCFQIKLEFENVKCQMWLIRVAKCGNFYSEVLSFNQVD